MVLLLSCEKENPQQPPLFELLDAAKSHIDFKNEVTESDSLNILDYLYFYNGGGVAVGDVNNDGLQDVFFSSNQNSNKLYLNKGNLQFEDVTDQAGVSGHSDWNTGSLMADINGDGWLDLYVMAVVGVNGFEGHNEFFLNNGDGTFTEKSAEFGLDLQCFGTHAAVLDYDLDGDLDLYILNHAVHTQESFGRAQIRNQRNDKTGDRLLRNDGDSFTDVSEMAGIYGGINGYGLGISIADFNKDGFPDIYVGNDFHEDDYFYLNNGDGSFTESLKAYFGHTSRFSMGNDAADINHDGWPDLISLDMLAEDDAVIKASEGDDMYQTLKMRTEQYGYHFQYSRNMLFTSQPGHPYLETALLSGVAATDWSWSALFADYDMDGEKDLFISNGIPKRPNNLDYIRFISNEQIQRQLNDSRLVDQKAIEMMPAGLVANYFFKGSPELHFKDVTDTWSEATPTISGATALCDLDNDGDLDLVTNNINEVASVYVNNSKNKNAVSFTLEYKDRNPFGIGTKVYCYSKGQLQYQELYTVRGFQATSQALIHFGMGNHMNSDSLIVVWPDQTKQTLIDVAANKPLRIAYQPETEGLSIDTIKRSLFRKVENNLGIDYVHKEDNHTDFNYQKLIPYEISDRGPALAVGDLNFDGLDDLFLGGAQGSKSEVFIQDKEGYKPTHLAEIDKDSMVEDVSAVILKGKDVVNLKVASGGNAISTSKKQLQNHNYKIDQTTITSSLLGDEMVNCMIIKEDNGNLFIGNHSNVFDFGSIPSSKIIGIDGNTYELGEIGMVTDAVWDDFSGDGKNDLIVIGEWMKPLFLEQTKEGWKETNLLDLPLNGLWQSLEPFDIDHDGDTDYLLGNWGLNSKFTASAAHPMRMYYADFDENGTTETLVAVYKNGKYVPLLGLDELSSQMVFLRKKFTNYKDFAGKSMEEIMGDLLKKATLFEVHTLSSGFLRNEGGKFTFESFELPLQVSPILDFEKFDFNSDGKQEVLMAGNYFGVIPFHGRYDSFPGALIYSDTKYELGNRLGLDLAQKSVRHLKIIQLQNKPYLLIVYNNDKAEVYEIVE